MRVSSKLLLLPALALLAACASHETRVATPTARSQPPSSNSPVLTGALGAPIAPMPPAAGGNNAPQFSGTTSAPVAMPGAPTRMSANEITAALSNNTAEGVTTEGLPYEIYFSGDGQERFRQANFADNGTWRVLPDGRLCTSLTRVNDDTQQCYVMYKKGQTITFDSPEGVTVGNVTVVPGNPKRL
ncbi:MAG TPA: hypothetical protein VJ747_11370 [Stellaceae bacterium]|nr:hypothetical protein [Stellaceae bacterium]